MPPLLAVEIFYKKLIYYSGLYFILIPWSAKGKKLDPPAGLFSGGCQAFDEQSIYFN